MEILVIVDHPNLENSRVHKRWIQELKKHSARFKVHHLQEVYPDEKINIPAEQELLSAYDFIVIQFPFYWFNCPPLLKKWLDEVLTYGWAYGSNSGYAMAGKYIHIAITVGIQELAYGPDGTCKYTIEELLRPFELTFNYVKSCYSGHFACYDLNSTVSVSLIEDSVINYFHYLNDITNKK